MAEALHHQHTRKRVYQNLEPYPHGNDLVRIVDRLIYFAAFFSIIMTLPQVANIWLDHNASGVSPISWGAYTVTATLWLAYGALHKENQLMIVYGAFLVLNLLVLVGVLVYG